MHLRHGIGSAASRSGGRPSPGNGRPPKAGGPLALGALKAEPARQPVPAPKFGKPVLDWTAGTERPTVPRCGGQQRRAVPVRRVAVVETGSRC